MKKSLILLSCIALVSVVIVGAGCKREAPRLPKVNTNNQATVQDSDSLVEDDSSMETTEIGEPTTLAILLLTQESQVTVTRGSESTDAVNQMELYAGDQVSVIKSEAQLLYPDIGISILPEGTKVTIMPGEGAENGGFSSQILLEAGKIWTRLEHVLGSDESFSVESSDVVATVRGTAFGVSIINGEIEISVANSQVAVSTREAIKGISDIAQKAVLVAAGNALKVNPTLLKPGENPRAELLKNLRKVSDTEKKDIYYRFTSQRLDTDQLKKPDQTFKWSAPINVSDKLIERLTPEQINRLRTIRDNQIKVRPELLENEALMRELIIKSVRFQVPLKEVILKDMTTDDTPSALGPIN